MIRNNRLPFKSVQIKKHQCYFYYIIFCWKVRVLTPIIGCHSNVNFAWTSTVFIFVKVNGFGQQPLCSQLPFNLTFRHSLTFSGFFACICSMDNSKVQGGCGLHISTWEFVEMHNYCVVLILWITHRHFTHFPREFDRSKVFMRGWTWHFFFYCGSLLRRVPLFWFPVTIVSIPGRGE